MVFLEQNQPHQSLKFFMNLFVKVELNDTKPTDCLCNHM